MVLTLPNISDLALWGVPLLGIVLALIKLGVELGLPAKFEKHLKGLLLAAGFVLISTLPQLYLLWPPLETVGPLALFSLTIYLVSAGYYDIQDNLVTTRRALTARPVLE